MAALSVDRRLKGSNCYQPQPEDLRQVEQEVWQACAGSSVQIPAVDARVYYFAQGHMEHASDALPLSAFSPALASSPCIPCRVTGVLFLADRVTDEVYVKICLQPLFAPGNRTTFLLRGPGSCLADGVNGGDAGRSHKDNGVVSFAKVLTPSDANNGGGFSVPKFCADSIFPPLDYDAEPPVQNITIRDVHGEVWQFRHIYRGTPKRHLLTTGWSKFVNSKNLIAGDSVVFMRNKIGGELAVGVRRIVKTSCTADEAARWVQNYAYLGQGAMKPAGKEVRIGVKEGVFSRSGKGKVAPEEVVGAANRAVSGEPFEVVYYPKAGSPCFVVAAEKVERASFGTCWSGGMRVKMAMETEDSSRMTWFQGTVASVLVPDSGLWKGSPWRMLQVAWDEPEVLKNIKKVSPWEVEYVAPTPPLPVFPPSKKFRASPMFLTEGEGDFPLPLIGYRNSMLGQFSSSHLNYNSFPAGMQGARQDSFYVSSFHNIINDRPYKVCGVDYSDHTMAPKDAAVSTNLNIGPSRSESPPDSTCSVDFIRSDLRVPVSSVKTFQLFGQIISVEVPASDTEDACLTKSAESQDFKDTKGRRNMLEVFV